MGSKTVGIHNRFTYDKCFREENFREGLKKLKKEILRANTLAREANMIIQELMGPRRGAPCYEVTLQIPAANLRPSRIRVRVSGIMKWVPILGRESNLRTSNCCKTV